MLVSINKDYYQMSSHLVYRIPVEGRRLSNELKFALERMQEGIPQRLKPEDIPYLKALSDNEVIRKDEYETVSYLICLHDYIELSKEY